MRGTVRALICLLTFSTAVHAEELATSFVDIMLPDVTVGVPYDMALQKQRRVEYHNLGKHAVRLRVEILIPAMKELSPGHEAIPDASWITVQPTEVAIEPGETATCNLIVRIPAEKRYRRRRFEARVWGHTLPNNENGLSINLGVLSKLRFQTMP
jgi:hypothetical protein